MNILRIKTSSIFLGVVFLLAFLLRFWNLSSLPVSLSHDEVAIGYNAWSVLQTGKDEYGTLFPVLFRSFDDYKLPGYIYATVISEKLFGLNEFAVRFPSAFLGVLTVIVFYFLVKEIFVRKKTHNNTQNYAEIISLLSAAMLAISPWHVNFSRAAFEANGSLFFIVLSVYLLFKSLKNPKYLVLTAVISIASLYFYYTARLVLPIIFLVFIFMYEKQMIVYKKWLILSFFIGLIFFAPLLSQIFSSGLSRINQVSIFEDKSLTDPYREAIIRNNNSTLAKVVYNRRVAYLQQFSDNYLKNFSPDFYFTTGTGPMGLMYLWEAPFFLFGLYSILKINNKWKWVVIAWFFSVPIVGGLTTGQPNALRTLANVPMVVLFSSLGIYNFFNIVKQKKYFKILLAFLMIVSIFFFIRFVVLYFDYYPRLVASHWGDGHKQMAMFIKQNKEKYDYVYVTGDYWRPYIYMLFYLEYSPSNYQKNGDSNKFENIYFGKSNWDRGEGIDFANTDISLLVKKKTLFILTKNDFFSQKNLIEKEHRPYQLKIIKEIDGRLTEDVFYAVVMQ